MRNFHLFAAALTSTTGLHRRAVSNVNHDFRQDTLAECAAWAAIGQCEANPGYMSLHCQTPCAGKLRATAVVESEPNEVTRREFETDASGENACRDEKDECITRAARGCCKEDVSYMHNSCTLACGLFERTHAIQASDGVDKLCNMSIMEASTLNNSELAASEGPVMIRGLLSKWPRTSFAQLLARHSSTVLKVVHKSEDDNIDAFSAAAYEETLETFAQRILSGKVRATPQ